MICSHVLRFSIYEYFIDFLGHIGDINLMTLMTRRFIFWKKRLQFGMFIVHFYPPNQSP